MPYVLLIVERGEKRRSRPPQEGQIAYARMARYTEELKARGVLIASDSLKSDADGVRIEVRDGRRTLMDGPFAESKEIVGGFFLINCQSRDQALAIASECPAAEWATVEVRETGPCHGQ